MVCIFDVSRKLFKEGSHHLTCPTENISAYLDDQLRYINNVSWISGNVAVHMRKVDNLECEVISLIVDADTERCVLHRPS